MSSSEFVSLCRDFTNLSDCVKIEVKDDKCTFIVNGKAGNGKCPQDDIYLKWLTPDETHRYANEYNIALQS